MEDNIKTEGIADIAEVADFILLSAAKQTSLERTQRTNQQTLLLGSCEGAVETIFSCWRLIYELENGQTGQLSSGYSLMQAVAGGTARQVADIIRHLPADAYLEPTYAYYM